MLSGEIALKNNHYYYSITSKYKFFFFFFFFFSFRLIPKKLMSSYTGMEECQKNKHKH